MGGRLPQVTDLSIKLGVRAHCLYLLIVLKGRTGSLVEKSAPQLMIFLHGHHFQASKEEPA